MFITTLAESNEFRFHFIDKTNPWVGSIREDKTETKIEVWRSGEEEEIAFRTQGELVALYVAKPEMETPLLHCYNPSPEIDLHAFHEACREIYEEIPEIAAYLRDGFTATPQEMLNFTAGPGDRAVLAAVLAVEDIVYEGEELPEL